MYCIEQDYGQGDSFIFPNGSESCFSTVYCASSEYKRFKVMTFPFPYIIYASALNLFNGLLP